MGGGGGDPGLRQEAQDEQQQQEGEPPLPLPLGHLLPPLPPAKTAKDRPFSDPSFNSLEFSAAVLPLSLWEDQRRPAVEMKE